MPEYHLEHPHHKPRAHIGIIFRRVAEILAIVLSILGRSSIARFLGTKFMLDFVVEYTALFGREAGHRLSTLLAFIAAQPQLITIIVTGIILMIELILFIVRVLSKHRRRRRHPH